MASLINYKLRRIGSFPLIARPNTRPRSELNNSFMVMSSQADHLHVSMVHNNLWPQKINYLNVHFLGSTLAHWNANSSPLSRFHYIPAHHMPCHPRFFVFTSYDISKGSSNRHGDYTRIPFLILRRASHPIITPKIRPCESSHHDISYCGGWRSRSWVKSKAGIIF